MADTPEPQADLPSTPIPLEFWFNRDPGLSIDGVNGQNVPANAKPQDGPTGLYVVSDSVGFVGAFPTARAAEDAVFRKYPEIPCIVQRFPVAPGPCDNVWVVLYRDLDAVAFVSNSRAEAERVRQVYARVGLAYDDDVDHWEQPFGVASKPAAERLERRHRVHEAFAGELGATDTIDERTKADLDRLDALSRPREDGPLARLLRENEPITIMDCVVPIGSASTPDADTLSAEEFASTLGLAEPVAARNEDSQPSGGPSLPSEGREQEQTYWLHLGSP
jgi:hypothetical protein